MAETCDLMGDNPNILLVFWLDQGHKALNHLGALLNYKWPSHISDYGEDIANERSNEKLSRLSDPAH